MYVCIRVSLCLCACVSACVHIWYAYMHVYMYVCMYVSVIISDILVKKYITIYTSNRDLIRSDTNIYTTFINFNMKYHVMCNVYTDVRVIK